MVLEHKGWEPSLSTTTWNGQTLISGAEQKEKKKKWTEECLARSWRRSSIEATTHLGCTRCISACSGMAIGVMSTELTMQCLMWHTWSNVLLCIQCHRPIAQPYLRCEDTEGGLGKSETYFRREYHDLEIAAQARAWTISGKGIC